MAGKGHTHELKAVGVTTGSPVFGRPTLQAFEPMPDDHPCYAIVGKIAAETARIEFLLDQAIADASRMGGAMSACLTGQMIGPVPRFTALIQLCRQRELSEPLVKAIDTAKGKASNLFDRRNRAVHDPWMTEVGTGEPHQFRGKPRASREFGVVPVTLTKLSQDLDALRKLRETVNGIVGSVWTEMRKRFD